jgi:DNA-binding HxlR family transcriptional regulator
VADHPDWNVLLRTCPSRTSLAEIANKWTALIVVVLGQGPLRFTQLRDQVDGISPKVLAETLRRLQRDGIVTRQAYAEMPPRVEYELTDLGRTLRVPLDALRVWAEANIDDVLKSRDAFDRA